MPAGKVIRSQVQAWLASYSFGSASQNLFLEFIRAVYALALADRIVPHAPVDGIKTKKRELPIRKTPTLEDFRAIVASIRSQQFADTAADSGDFVEFIGLAGLGQAEAGALTWDDVDWPNEQITTFRHKTRCGFAVPIFPQLRPLLERIRDACGGSPLGSDKVFRVKEMPRRPSRRRVSGSSSPRVLRHKVQQAEKTAHTRPRGHLLGKEDPRVSSAVQRAPKSIPVRLTAKKRQFRTGRTVLFNISTHTGEKECSPLYTKVGDLEASEASEPATQASTTLVDVSVQIHTDSRLTRPS